MLTYCTTFCNKAHLVSNGKPVEHECRILPPKALHVEMSGNFEKANDILQNTPPVYMQRGVRQK